MQLLAVVLIAGLTALTAYAGCRQLQELAPASPPADRVEAIDTIRRYVQRVEAAFHGTDDARAREDEAADGGP